MSRRGSIMWLCPGRAASENFWIGGWRSGMRPPCPSCGAGAPDNCKPTLAGIMAEIEPVARATQGIISKQYDSEETALVAVAEERERMAEILRAALTIGGDLATTIEDIAKMLDLSRAGAS